MAGPNHSQISSNWKKLQESLQANTKQDPATGNSLKRKREEGRKKATTAINGFKKAKLSGFRMRKGGKMGGFFSTPTDSPRMDDKTSKLIHDHDIDPSAVTAAYGITADTARPHTDDLNGGLHPRHKVGKYVALDCEMVGTGPPPHEDNVLARASLVNFHGEQIYDSFVQAPPGIVVEDYRTFVSGIKEHHMKAGYARPLKQVREDVAKLLDGRILVGHALRNDLNALVLNHPPQDLRDTSRHPKFRVESRGKPPALRKLARSELGLEIQTGEHSSVEDARATMLLFQKEKKGFEEENRKHFRQRTRSTPARPTKEKQAMSNVDGEEDDIGGQDDVDDEDLLDGEEDVEFAYDMPLTRQSTQPRAKKRKTKKRTKRK